MYIIQMDLTSLIFINKQYYVYRSLSKHVSASCGAATRPFVSIQQKAVETAHNL